MPGICYSSGKVRATSNNIFGNIYNACLCSTYKAYSFDVKNGIIQKGSFRITEQVKIKLKLS